AILGPSGCGKTTILRIIAGLERHDGGRIFMEGADVSSWPVSQRNIGLVFQSYALFPNMTTARNVAYGLGSRQTGETARRVDELLSLVGLRGLENKYPAQLSGGQQQRVALARALAPWPAILLLDEPLSALDAKVRARLRAEIRSLQRRLGLTTILVTHDQEEALTMADRVLVVSDGRLVQAGTPQEIYDRPTTTFVASFIGSMNFIENTIKEAPCFFRKNGVGLRVKEEKLAPGQPAVLAIRPEEIILAPNGCSGPNTLPAQVSHLEYRGSSYRVTLNVIHDGRTFAPIEAEIPAEKYRRLGLYENMTIPIDLPADRLRVYAAD
ncbi:MAG: TOBE-like domain-containing protein, partial [Deltaproteobacteria bacterium]|nr:TOBE-like domain-containing protein [Deltaproteobacteria bacterium]